MLNTTSCIPCIVKQAQTLSQILAITDEDEQRTILFETMKALMDPTVVLSAPHFSTTLQTIVAHNNHGGGTYAVIKERNRRNAEQYIPYLSMMIAAAADPFEMAVRASIIGNTIDLGANPHYDLEKEINTVVTRSVNLDVLPSLKADVGKAKHILFIGDNYEEALFDKLLIQQLLPAKITFAVRSHEILNDITLADAHRLEVDTLCPVIESGSVIAGTALEQCSDQFMELYNSSDVVIAKGQGNYETLLDAERPIYFMFKVKCEAIAERCGYPLGSSVLHFHRGTRAHC